MIHIAQPWTRVVSTESTSSDVNRSLSCTVLHVYHISLVYLAYTQSSSTLILSITLIGGFLCTFLT